MANRLKMDAARWVIPQQVASLSSVTTGRIIRLLWRYTALQAMFWFRLGSWLMHKRVPGTILFQKLLYHFYGLEIQIGADYRGGLYLAHPIGSVIAAQAIGENCTIISRVTIGMRNTWEFPVIGKNVFIGTGACILGGIRIGDDVLIGANTVVVDDIPSGATVVGAPGRVIKIYGQPVAPVLTQ